MFERIVAAVDADPDRSGKVVQAAAAVGKAFSSEVLVVHVRELERHPATVVSAARAGLPPSIHFESEEMARQLVEDATDRLRSAGVSSRGEVASGTGSTARELLETAKSFSAGLIVVGDRSSAVSDFLLGSVANRILHLAECPVLLAR